MDSLPEDEIEAIWQRIKVYIQTDKVKSISTRMIAEEIENEMNNAHVPESRKKTPQSFMGFLIQRGFPREAAKNDKIKSEIISSRIILLKVKGKDRFQLGKGTPTFKTKEGRQIKAGQFISGKTKDEATKKLQIKIES